MRLGEKTKFDVLEDTNISFGIDSYIYSDGSINIKGTKDSPKNLSNPIRWNGIYLSEKSSTSTIEYAKIKNVVHNFFGKPYIEAGINFAGKSLYLSNIEFENNKNALHLFGNSKTTAKNLSFKGNENDVILEGNARLSKIK